MSTLGSVASQLEREQELLRRLNTALLALEAEALGRIADFGFSDQDVADSRTTLSDFVKRLRDGLAADNVSVDLQPLVDRMKGDMKPLEDWRADLGGLETRLQRRDRLDESALPVIEDVLTLLDSEFTQDLRRLYAH